MVLLRHSFKKSVLFTVIAIMVMLSLSSCGGDAATQQQAAVNKAHLDTALSHARQIGVPQSMLQPVIDQEMQLAATTAPLALFGDQSATSYYSNISQRYEMLALQVQGLETQSTQQSDYQAALDIQTFSNTLAQRQAQNFVEAKTFSAQLTQDQKLMAQAQTPGQYIAISANAKRSTQALRLMGPAYDSLTALQHLIKQLKASHIDTTALDQQYQQDLQLFRTAGQPEDYTTLLNQTNVQLQATSDFSTQAIPYVGQAKLLEFRADIQQLKAYGQDATTFEQHLKADQTALDNATSINDYLKVSSQIDHDISSLQFATTKGYAAYLLKQFHQEVVSWGNAHQYHDPTDGGNYNLDYEYDMQGIGQDADNALAYAQSTQAMSDYQAAIDLYKNDMVQLKAMEADYADTTPWNQAHATDMQMMQHYGVGSSTAGPVLVVSLIEQTLRYYNNGKLVRAFQIVTGQYLKPSPPGFWSIILRQHPTVFKSSEPQNSVFWYPPTPIQYALEYHAGGYFFHDSWWRNSYGKYHNFPHSDPPSTTSFNDNGSHGCVNMDPNDIQWLFPQIPWGAAVILY